MPKQSQKARILFLGSQMEVAGAQRVLLSQARWFHAQGYPVMAVFFYDKQGLAERWQAENDFPVRSLGAWRYGGFPLANYLRALVGMLRLFGLLRGSVDVMESFTPQSNVLGMPVAWLAGVPIRLPTHHGYIEGSSKLLARVHGWMVNVGLASKLVAVSEQVRDYAIERERVAEDHVVVIENGIEAPNQRALSPGERERLRAELSVPQDGKLLLTVGRLTVQKGHTVLLKAIAQIKQQIPNAVFAFAGEGHQRSALEAEARALGVEEQVRFLGVREDVGSLLLAADLFVQPSLWEGLSLAMLEALLAGVPVLATQVEGVVDVIENGTTGMLVPAGDVGALAQGLLELLEDEAQRHKLGRAGRKHAEKHYSIERMCQQYERLIQELMADGAVRG